MYCKILLYLPLFLILVACSNSAINPNKLQQKLEKAVDYNDYYTAIYYAHELLALDGAHDSTALQLAELYKITKNYAGAIKVVDELLPNASTIEQISLWKIKIEALSNSRNYALAISAYDSLSLIDKEHRLEYLYEVGVLYFQGRDIENGIATMQRVIQNPVSKTIVTSIRSDWGEDKVPYYLAALNYIGYIQIETKQLEKATITYDEIKKSGIPFKLAEGNQKLLENRKTQAN